MNYYQNKILSLKEIFGKDDIILFDNKLMVGDQEFPIVNDVIILLQPEKYSNFVKQLILSSTGNKGEIKDFAQDIQYSFGEEWKEYKEILPEHSKEFEEYFDLVDIRKFSSKRVCDLGCGSGRWSSFLSDKCKEMVLVDFSDAIFVARNNLKNSDNCLFFMCDIKDMRFKNDFADFLFCLGVLHHLPTNCLDEVRNLKRFSSELLIYLYYALDNRPGYYQILLKLVTGLRLVLSRVQNKFFRGLFSHLGVYLIYYPLILIGGIFQIFNKGKLIPLYEAYKDKTFKRIEQDVYDRFFTGIEQRVSRKEILSLIDTFSTVVVSDNKPYWHFIAKR